LVPEISKKEQERISGVLGPLDDKIACNLEINEKLAKMARVIFEHWFVKYEFPDDHGKPYRTNGGRFVRSRLGEIPEGWSVSRVADESRTILGGTPERSRSDFWENGTIPWIDSGQINEFPVVRATENITARGLGNSAAKMMPVKTVVLPLVISIGRPIRISLLGIETCGNQSVLGIVGDKRLPAEYVYYWVEFRKDDIYSWATGGAQQHINKKNVDDTPILVPDEHVIREYTKLVTPLFDKLIWNARENVLLTNLRDKLLPRLMSGKIRVPVEVR
jgi:type I restriction enzyme S subunit